MKNSIALVVLSIFLASSGLAAQTPDFFTPLKLQFEDGGLNSNVFQGGWYGGFCVFQHEPGKIKGSALIMDVAKSGNPGFKFEIQLVSFLGGMLDPGLEGDVLRNSHLAKLPVAQKSDGSMQYVSAGVRYSLRTNYNHRIVAASDAKSGALNAVCYYYELWKF